jgi:hypothetical protein
MMDVADRAESEVESYVTSQINHNKLLHGCKITPKGKCHYCEEPVEHPKLFCNGECASDYDREEKIKARAGIH